MFEKILNRTYVDYVVYSVTTIKGKYGFRVKLIFSNNDEMIKQHSGFKLKSNANKERNKVISQLENHTYVVDSNIKASEFFDYWLENIMKPKITYNSYMSYRNIVNNYLNVFFKNMKLCKINVNHIKKIYGEVTEQHKSVAKLLRVVLKAALNFATMHNLISSDPTENIYLPKNVNYTKYGFLKIDTSKVLDEEQVKILIEKSKNTPIYLHILFAVIMGFRKQEINGLKYSDVDFVNRKIHICRQLGVKSNSNKDDFNPKTYTKQEIPLKTKSSDRVLDIPDIVFDAIVEERQKYEQNRRRRINDKTHPFLDLDYICCSTYGHPRSKGFHQKYFKKLLEENNLPNIRFHDLRHTCATMLLNKGFNVKAVSLMLGHSSTIITTAVYYDKSCLVIDLTEELNRYIDKVKPINKINENVIDFATNLTKTFNDFQIA